MRAMARNDGDPLFCRWHGLLRRAAVFTTLVLLLLRPVYGQEQATRITDRFRITCEPADVRTVDRVLALADAVYPRLIAYLGAPVADTIHIHIASSLEEFQNYTSAAIPDWGAGYAIPDLNLIVLKSPRIPGSSEGLNEVVVHELAHALLHARMRGVHVPRWLDEGFAMYIAREWGLWDRASLMMAALTDNLVPLSAIGAVNTFSSGRAGLAYQQCAIAIQRILQLYGQEGLNALLHRFHQTGSINRAFLDTFGITEVQFENDLIAHIKQAYGWEALPGEGLTLMIGPLFVILCVLAYISMRFRRRAILARWEAEEEAEYGWNSEDDAWNRMKRRFSVIRGGKAPDDE